MLMVSGDSKLCTASAMILHGLVVAVIEVVVEVVVVWEVGRLGRVPLASVM